MQRTPRRISLGWIALAGLCVATAALPVCAREPGPEDLVVALKPHALVHDRQYTLGEVADVSGGDAEAARRLGSLVLGASPRLGYTEQLLRAEIQRLVRTHLGGELAERITWEGAGVLKLETAGVPYDGLSIVDAAAAHVREVLSSRYEHLEIHPAEAPPRIELPKGDVTLRSRDAAPMNPPRSRVPVWVDISIDGAFYRTIIVPLRVEIPGTALYSRRALPRGAAALPEDFEARPVDLAAVGAEVADPTTAFGRHLARTLPAGEPLLRSSLQQSLAVNKGDIVTLLVHTGVIEIESLATALSSGVVGQKVRIKPTAGDDVIAAEVVSPNVVKLITR